MLEIFQKWTTCDICEYIIVLVVLMQFSCLKIVFFRLGDESISKLFFLISALNRISVLSIDVLVDSIQWRTQASAFVSILKQNNVEYSRVKPTKTELKRTKQTKTQWMNLYVYKILNNILSFLSIVVVFGGTNAQTHFGFKHFETESSDKYYCRCDKQFIQLKNSVSICEYLSYYMERFDNILSLQIEYIRTDSVEFFFRLFVHLLKCLFHTLTVRSLFFFRVIFADVRK